MNELKLKKNTYCIDCDNLLYNKQNILNNCELIEHIDKKNINKYCFIHMLEHDSNFKQYIINNNLKKLYKICNNAIINKNKKYNKFKIEYDKEFFKISKNINIPTDNIVYDSNHINNIKKIEDEYQKYKKYNYDKYLKKTESDFIIHWRFWMLEKFSENHYRYLNLIEERENDSATKNEDIISPSNNNNNSNNNSNFSFIILSAISSLSNLTY